MREVVASGRTVEDAKQEAFRELGVKSEKDVEVEIIDEGSKGVFGWGTKFARVKVRLLKESETGKTGKKGEEKSAQEKTAAEDKKKVELKKAEPKKAEPRKPAVRERAEMPPIMVGERPLPVPVQETPPPLREKKAPVRVEKQKPEPVKAEEPKKEEKSQLEDYDEYEEIERMEKSVEEPLELDSLELMQLEETGGPFSVKEILRNILQYMGAEGEVKIRKTSIGPVFSIEGKDLGILIGKHGQTLEALQFLVNLILLRRTDRKQKITLDVEGYRSRREKSLQELARRLADKARREKRNIVLEPMLPSERRIIHLTLQNNPHVSTFSQGEEPMRKVIITPKKRSERNERNERGGNDRRSGRGERQDRGDRGDRKERAEAAQSTE